MKTATPPLRRTFVGHVLLLVLAIVSPLLADPTAPGIVSDMKRVADWQIANPSKHAIHDWTQAPFFLGLSSLHQVSGEA